MNSLTLTLQTFFDMQWHDMAILSFDNKTYKFQHLEYLEEYAMQHLLEDNLFACSLHYPINFYNDNKGFAYFLDDIVPSGASRNYWENALNLRGLKAEEAYYQLLKYGAIAPIGHLRIKEAYEEIHNKINQNTVFYTIDDVKNRCSSFLEHCHEQGMIVSGATGAGGEAPKILIRMNLQQHIWIDNEQSGKSQDDYFLVKYPRHKKTERDCDILRAEYYYYQELASMGFDTIDIKKMRLEEGEDYPSLWLPRFDIIHDENGNCQRYAVESVYSLMQKGAGSTLKHEACIEQLINLIQKSNTIQNGGVFNVAEFVIEWVRRDLLNIIFGNSDNHGRNIAFLRSKNDIKLAPIYDFAPMKADPEGIVRTIKWSDKVEKGGEYDFQAIAESLAYHIEPSQLMSALHQTAQQLLDLQSQLHQRGVPTSILTFPTIGFDKIPEKLERWKLL